MTETPDPLPASRADVEKALHDARIAVIRARACWASWAQATSAVSPGSQFAAVAVRLALIDQAVERGESALEEALALLGKEDT